MSDFDSFTCVTCGHPPSWHRLDDSTNIAPSDPRAKFRCIGYDCRKPGQAHACTAGCADFVAPPGYVEALDVAYGAKAKAPQ